MAKVIAERRAASARASRADARPAPSLVFDGVIAALGLWFLSGVYLDGWAHQHVPSLETFFTPWHAVLYSGFLAVAAVLFITAASNYLRGYSLTHVVPAGYELSLVGVALFMVGGVGDLIWHTLFGIEANVEALLSPTHLLLAAGGILTLTGPLRAGWQRKQLPPSALAYGPLLLSALAMFSTLTFFTQYAHPFGQTLAARGSGSGFANQALALSSILLQTALLMGFVLLLLRRWRLPFGALTLLIGANTALMVLMRSDSFGGHNLATGAIPLFVVGLLGGLAGDGLIAQLAPSPERIGAFRLFSFALPVILYTLYFAALALLGGGIGWSIHLWAGSIFTAGVVGLLLSYAFLPPMQDL